MSELKAETIVPQGSAITLQMYPNAETDAVIEEKDRALEFAKALTLKNIEIIKEKDKEIAELKEQLHDAEMQADLAECAVTEYKIDYDKLNDNNRRLKRALWLARANSAEGQFFYWCARFGVESGFTKADIRGYSVNTNRRLRTIGEWIEYWKNVKSKCLKKVEEYK